MKAAIIGGTGHVGSFLVRMLADRGHDVIVISSGRTASHLAVPDGVTLVRMDYPTMVASGEFGSMLRDERPDAVVDILQGNTPVVYDACRDSSVGHLVVCGSTWMFGRPRIVPTPETKQADCEFASYAQRYAAILETLARSAEDGYPFTAVMPPNICGPGKVPLDGAGGRSVDVHRAHQRGESVPLPYPGTNLIGPCDAEDVAQGFVCAIENRDAAAGEVFNVGSAYALTAKTFVGTYSAIHGSAIGIEFVSMEQFVSEVMPDPGANLHFVAHMCPDITRITSRLGYRPRYTPEQTMERAVRWMQDEGMLTSG